jgi:hypothetical protein
MFVFLDLSGLLPGTHVVTPRVVLPDGISAEGVLPETAEVVIVPLPADATPEATETEESGPAMDNTPLLETPEALNIETVEAGSMLSITLPATTLPATTLPATTLPATTLPAARGTLPATITPVITPTLTATVTATTTAELPAESARPPLTSTP